MKKYIGIIIVMCMAVLSACSGTSKGTQADQGVRVYCKDETGKPVPAVQVQLCTDETCLVSLSDYKGLAAFDVVPGQYAIKVQSAPEGYVTSDGDEITTSEDNNRYEVILTKGAAAAAAAETVPQDTKEGTNDTTGGIINEEANSNGAAADDAAKTAAATGDDADNVKLYEYKDMKYLEGIDLTGCRLIMVNYWEPWCGYCIMEMPALEALYQKYKDQGLLIVGMHEDTDDAEEAVKATGVTYPIIHLDEESRYTSGGYPETVFVTPDGMLIGREKPDEYGDYYGYGGARAYEDWEKIILNKLGTDIGKS